MKDYNNIIIEDNNKFENENNLNNNDSNTNSSILTKKNKLTSLLKKNKFSF
jgi:hypothetical protein